MKIFVITGDKLNTGGGGMTHLIETFEAIAEAGHEVQLFAPQINISCSLPVQQIFTHYKGFVGVLFFNLSLLLALCSHIIADRPNCIYTRQLSYSFVPPLLARLFGIKHCLEVNGILYDELKLVNASATKLALIKIISRINCTLTNRISVTVPETKNRLMELYGTQKEKIEVISCAAANHHNFYPGDQGKARREVGFAEHDFIVGFAGTLYAWHGMDLFLTAVPELAAAIRHFRLVVIGDGVELDRLVSQARDLGVQHYITFTGLIPYQQIPTYIQTFDVGISFFKPVRPIPGIPMKMYEYMACAIPVIASAYEGYGPVVAELGAGLSVNTNNPAEIVDGLIKLSRDPALRAAMGQKGQQSVEERFNWEKVALEVEDFITRALC